MKITCPQCGFSREVPRSKLPEGQLVAKCPKCQCRFRFSADSGPGAILPPKAWGEKDSDISEEELRAAASNAYAAEAARFEKEKALEPVNPWEMAPEPSGWFSAFYRTLIRVMFQPQIFFRYLDDQNPIWRPLAFFLLICVFQTLVERMWMQSLQAMLVGDATDDPQLARLLEMLTPQTGILISLLFRSAILVMQLYIFSLLMFLGYRLVARERASFRLVFQVLAYASAPWVLCIIPAVGSIVGLFWGIGCVAIGCKTALNLSWPQTMVGVLPVLALLAPFFVQLMRLLS